MKISAVPTGEAGTLVLAEWAAAHGSRLLSAARAFCGDGIEAEDLVQETFSEAAAGWARFEGRSAPYTWIYGILRRRFLLQCRRKRRFLHWASSAGRRSSSAEPADPPAPFDADPESARDRRLDLIAAAVRGQSAKHREVLHLRYVEGRTIAEIAALVAISEGTVKSRLHHALRRVQTVVGREAEPRLAPAREKAHEL